MYGPPNSITHGASLNKTREKNAVNPLIIIGSEEELDESIRRLTRREGISLYQAAL